MKPIKGTLYEVQWKDALQSPNWTSETDLDKNLDDAKKPVRQILTFLREKDGFYQFTTGKHTGDGNWADCITIPKEWTTLLKKIGKGIT